MIERQEQSVSDSRAVGPFRRNEVLSLVLMGESVQDFVPQRCFIHEGRVYKYWMRYLLSSSSGRSSSAFELYNAVQAS